MKSAVLIILVLTCSLMMTAKAQMTISGKVSDSKQKPVAYASVSIFGTYEGTITNDSGRFEIKTRSAGPVRIMVTAVGFETAFADVDSANRGPFLIFKLKETYAALSPAVITAGTFAASEQGKAEIFRPRDIGTTAGAPGDIQATVESLPGTQRVGYTEGLFVRGGSGRESKYIMDGLIFPDPYYSNVPSLKQHGRLDPFLFSGTTFSAGGYSAQYGQALSSVLILNSKGIADSTKAGGGIHSFGGNLFRTKRWAKSSLHTNVSYNDLSLYHTLVNSKTHWLRSPLIGSLRLMFRYKPDKSSMLKVFTEMAGTKTGIRLNQSESLNPVDFNINNWNLVLNGTYTRFLKGDRSSIYAGASFSTNSDRIRLSGLPLEQSDKTIQVRATFKHSLTNDLRLYAGAEYLATLLYGRSDTLHSAVNDHLLSFFTEAEATVRTRIALRAGVRSEFSQYAGNNVSPRVSIAYKFTGASQISISYGVFRQLPDKTDMLYNPRGLSQEKATHYLINYQFRQNERTLRAEVFFKKYDNLASEFYPVRVTADAGYAKGFEVFFRDKESVGNLDWWISYSYCDSKRKTIITGEDITPDYISAHSLTLVVKYWFARPGILASTSLSYSSPRSYYYQGDFNVTKKLPIPARYGMDISLSKPCMIFRKPALIFFSWQNITGFDKVLGYIRIPSMHDPFTVYRTEKRSLFIGIFISMYND